MENNKTLCTTSLHVTCLSRSFHSHIGDYEVAASIVAFQVPQSCAFRMDSWKPIPMRGLMWSTHLVGECITETISISIASVLLIMWPKYWKYCLFHSGWQECTYFYFLQKIMIFWGTFCMPTIRRCQCHLTACFVVHVPDELIAFVKIRLESSRIVVVRDNEVLNCLPLLNGIGLQSYNGLYLSWWSLGNWSSVLHQVQQYHKSDRFSLQLTIVTFVFVLLNARP